MKKITKLAISLALVTTVIYSVYKINSHEVYDGDHEVYDGDSVYLDADVKIYPELCKDDYKYETQIDTSIEKQELREDSSRSYAADIRIDLNGSSYKEPIPLYIQVASNNFHDYTSEYDFTVSSDVYKEKWFDACTPGEKIRMNFYDKGVLSDDTFLTQLNIIKKELGISDEDFKKLNKTLKECTSEEYRERTIIKKQLYTGVHCELVSKWVDESSKDLIPQQIIATDIADFDSSPSYPSYTERIVDNERYSIQITIICRLDGTAYQIDIVSKTNTNYLEKAGFKLEEYNEYFEWLGEENRTFLEYTNYEGKYTGCSEILFKIDNEAGTIDDTINFIDGESFNKHFKMSGEYLGFSEDDMKEVYTALKDFIISSDNLKSIEEEFEEEFLFKKNLKTVEQTVVLSIYDHGVIEIAFRGWPN